jgi:PEP-CTERM motif
MKTQDYYLPRLLCAAIAASLAMASAHAAAATITEWNFNSIGPQVPPFNSPAPTTGAGTAITLGMTNAYNGGNTASDDVLATPGVANPAFVETAWRIRGATHNGWATHAAGAPQYSQGLELDVSTVGSTNIQFAFDWFSTNQGIRDMQFQYNADVTNPAGWTNFAGTSPTGTYIANPGDWYNYSNPMITVDLSSIPAVNNDPNFGIRLVAAFDSTGHVANDFAGATLSGGMTALYNNNSGNWRFGTLTVTGVPVPEPSTWILSGLCGVGILAGEIRRRAMRFLC